MNENQNKPACPERENNRRDCPCVCRSCARHGTCCECVKFHRERGDRPACFR